MTDNETISAALSAVAEDGHGYRLMRRNGRPFLAMSPNRAAALHVLNLYHPQMPLAILAVLGLRILVTLGLHRIFLPKLQEAGGHSKLETKFPSSDPGTVGLMMGSPEHRVSRVILCFRLNDAWEVAKLAFGDEGRSILEGEFAALASMPEGTKGVPQVLGLNQYANLSMLRLPYLHGKSPMLGQGMIGVDLLEAWVRDIPARPSVNFPEWPAIKLALETSDGGNFALNRFMDLTLQPVIRHGDFARWNLLEISRGEPIAIDWEWGHPEGMPGIDLAHLFLQDAWLVHKRNPHAVVSAVVKELSKPRLLQYLKRTGWGDNPLLPIIACLAWKQGAKHQNNDEVLQAALRAQ